MIEPEIINSTAIRVLYDGKADGTGYWSCGSCGWKIPQWAALAAPVVVMHVALVHPEELPDDLDQREVIEHCLSEGLEAVGDRLSRGDLIWLARNRVIDDD